MGLLLILLRRQEQQGPKIFNRLLFLQQLDLAKLHGLQTLNKLLIKLTDQWVHNNSPKYLQYYQLDLPA